MAKGIQSLELGYTLIEALLLHDRPVTLKELSQQVGMSPSKARMYLVSLLRIGLVAQDSETGLYALGPSALRLGLAALNQVDLMTSSREMLAVLTRLTQAPAVLTAYGAHGVTIVARGDSVAELPIDFRVGSSVPLTGSATGRVFLAYLPTTLTEQKLQQELAINRRTAGLEGITRESLAERCRSIRACGYETATEIVLATGIHITGYGAIAAPIGLVPHQPDLVVTVFYRRTTDADDAAMVDAVMRVVRAHTPSHAQPA